MQYFQMIHLLGNFFSKYNLSGSGVDDMCKHDGNFRLGGGTPSHVVRSVSKSNEFPQKRDQ